jgi:hypothetical protein
MPFWIDQLYIPPDNEAIIRATLATNPRIFNTLKPRTVCTSSLSTCTVHWAQPYTCLGEGEVEA